VVDDRDVTEMERLKVTDPFQLATPAFIASPMFAIADWLKLQTEVVHMAVKVVPEAQAPVRMHHRSALANTAEWRDVMNAVKSAKEGQAIIVTLEDEQFKPTKKTIADGKRKGQEVTTKPEVAFAYALRRYFTANGLPVTAYQSGKGEVTIRREKKK
jgi:hypothetical protein